MFSPRNETMELREEKETESKRKGDGTMRKEFVLYPKFKFFVKKLRPMVFVFTLIAADMF